MEEIKSISHDEELVFYLFIAFKNYSSFSSILWPVERVHY